MSDCKISTDKEFKTIKLEPVKGTIGVGCIICNESIPLNEHELMSLEAGHKIGIKVCDECRAAILKLREKQ